MKTYYEVYKVTPSGDTPDVDGIDYKGSCEAVGFDTLEEAIEYAETHGIKTVSQIGGSFDEFEQCCFCGEWFEVNELDTENTCDRCRVAIKNHEGV